MTTTTEAVNVPTRAGLSTLQADALALAYANRTREAAGEWWQVLAYVTPARRRFVGALAPDRPDIGGHLRPADQNHETRLAGWTFATLALAQAWAARLDAVAGPPAAVTVGAVRDYRPDPDAYGFELLAAVFGLPTPTGWRCRYTGRRRREPGHVWRAGLASGAIDRRTYNAARASCSRMVARLEQRGLITRAMHLGHAGIYLTPGALAMLSAQRLAAGMNHANG